MSAPIISTVSAPQIGERYRVPTVLYPYMGSSEPKVWPVLGPKHEDVKIIGFKDVHYHVDVRFLSERVFRSLSRNDRPGPPLVGFEHGHPLARRDPIFSPDGVLPHPPIVWRVRKMRRDLRPFPQIAFVPRLQQAYAGERCRMRNGLLRCPHKRAWIPTGDALLGEVICPQHGLRVNVADGVVCNDAPRLGARS